ncbi:hypothetical protein C6499_08800 [Candidatus Poribacteria bacterium]|nr:MAG: hypothetical protein C6499_08800 [Candidatus Poribacteria bacterium]
MKHKLKTTIFIFFLIGIAFSANAAKVEDFMPKESILYVQLQHIDEVYGEIETSETWQKALALLPDDSEEIRKAIRMAEAFLSTDLLSVLETIGYQTALAVWLDETESPQVGFVVHSGGNLSELQRFTKIAEGAIGLTGGNTLRLDAGVYQRVRYNVMEINQNIAKYGFIEDFLVLGVGEWSFEKLMDTYRNGAPSIRHNEGFAGMQKKIGSGEVVIFADMEHASSLDKWIEINGLDEWRRTQFPIFQSVYVRLNLLEPGPFHQVAVRFNPKAPDFAENEIGLFLEKGEKLEVLNALSGKEDLFIAVTSNVVNGAWKIVRSEIEKNLTDDIIEGISYLEGLLNLDLEDDVMTGLTGELALSVSDLSRFDPTSFESLEINADNSFTIDAAAVETDGGLIFKPTNFLKWNQFTNSLSNLQNISVSQTVYNEATLSEFATNIYYSEASGLFLFSFSEEQMYALVDGVKKKKKPAYLKHVPENPIVFAQLNLARALETAGEGALPADKVIVSSEEIAPSLTWVSVEDDTVLFEIVLSVEDTPLEVLAKLIPFYVWAMEN